MKKLATGLLCSALSTGVIAETNKVQQAIEKAKASPFSYNYVEVDYSDFDSDLDGLRVKGSFEIVEPFSIIGSLGVFSEKNVDVRTLSAGASYHLNVGSLSSVSQLDNLDAVIFAEIVRLEVEVDTAGGNAEDDEVGLRTGAEARYLAVDMLEVYLTASYSTVDINLGRGNGNYGDDFVIGSGIRFAPIDLLQLTAGFTFADDDELYIGVRFNF